MDSNEAGERSAKMWLALAEQLAAAVPDIVISDDPERAMKWAAYADACFFQATGEGFGFTVNELLFPKPTAQT